MTSSSPTRNALAFLLNGERVELSDVDPTMTLLQYLREKKRLTGTKEGCAEGDCGACTVALVNEEGSVRAVNSCIRFLPTLDGEEIISVEGLANAKGQLHPVQRAMVDSHGSQCGFCTPGFVMSLFALYKNATAVDRETITTALAGNLCRCTGYRPIIDAALQMHDLQADGSWLQATGNEGSDADARAAARQSIQSAGMLSLKHNDRHFFAPTTTAELDDCLAQHPDATILAGGTDVGLWVTKQHRQLQTVIYLGRVSAFQRTDVTSTHLEIGCGVTLEDAMPIIVDEYPTLSELFLRFASTPIRNSGTLGGNIANGSPIGDSMPVLIALETTIVLGSSAGSREVALEDFYLDYQKQDLRAGEYVSTIRIPRVKSGTQVRSYKISKRFDQDISAVCLGASVTLVDQKVTDIRLAFGGVAAIPKRARVTESELIGRSWDIEQLGDAIETLEHEFTPLDDMRASAQYRRWICSSLLKRLVEETSGNDAVSLYQHAQS